MSHVASLAGFAALVALFVGFATVAILDGPKTRSVCPVCHREFTKLADCEQHIVTRHWRPVFR